MRVHPARIYRSPVQLAPKKNNRNSCNKFTDSDTTLRAVSLYRNSKNPVKGKSLRNG